MKHLPESEFLQWAASKGLTPGNLYPDVVEMRFLDGAPREVYWDTPERPERRPYFLASLLTALGDWETCYGWRHSGSWPGAEEPDWFEDSLLIERAILSGIGMPLGTADVVRFARSDWAALLAAMFSASVFSWSVIGDLLVVPDNARCFMLVSHHDLIYATFRHAEDAENLSQEMQRREFGPAKQR